MSKFKKDNGKSAPAINTSALPDIVFMLLFFFMVATTAKESDPGVIVDRPTANAIEDVTILKQSNAIDFLYVGLPRDKSRGDIPRIVGDGQFMTLGEIQTWKHLKMSPRDGNYENYMTCMKIDKNIEMDLVTKIKAELIEVDALKVAYSATKKKKGKK